MHDVGVYYPRHVRVDEEVAWAQARVVRVGQYEGMGRCCCRRGPVHEVRRVGYAVAAGERAGFFEGSDEVVVFGLLVVVMMSRGDGGCGSGSGSGGGVGVLRCRLHLGRGWQPLREQLGVLVVEVEEGLGDRVPLWLVRL